MAISEFHASHIRRVKVGFVLSGLDLRPSEITRSLGLAPALSAVRGEDKRNFLGEVIGEEPEGFWRFDSVTGVDSKDINVHFEYLLSQLLPHKSLFFCYEAFFDVLWTSTYLYAGTGPLLSAEVCAGIAELRAGLGFDIHHIDEEE